MAPPALVVVTGATGFIALHCIAHLLRQGYRVRGTVRRAEGTRVVRDAVASVAASATQLEVCTADLLADEGWDAALAGAEGVLHTATPVPTRMARRDDRLEAAAVEGTRRVVAAATDAGATRVVVTSSIAAVMAGASRTPGRVFTEADWSRLDAPMPAYSRAKTLAEREAWARAASSGVAGAPEVVALNPAFVIGPPLGGVRNASNELVRVLIERRVPAVPRLLFPLVDVRDVADAHLRALTVPEAAGERFLLAAGEYWYEDLASDLRAAGYAVPTRVVPDWIVRTIGLFHPTVRFGAQGLGWSYRINSDKAREGLGWQPRPVHESLLDTADALRRRP